MTGASKIRMLLFSFQEPASVKKNNVHLEATGTVIAGFGTSKCQSFISANLAWKLATVWCGTPSRHSPTDTQRMSRYLFLPHQYCEHFILEERVNEISASKTVESKFAETWNSNKIWAAGGVCIPSSFYCTGVERLLAAWPRRVNRSRQH